MCIPDGLSVVQCTVTCGEVATPRYIDSTLGSPLDFLTAISFLCYKVCSYLLAEAMFGIHQNWYSWQTATRVNGPSRVNEKLLSKLLFWHCVNVDNIDFLSSISVTSQIYTDMKMSFSRNFHHWLHRKYQFRQLHVPPCREENVIKMTFTFSCITLLTTVTHTS